MSNEEILKDAFITGLDLEEGTDVSELYTDPFPLGTPSVTCPLSRPLKTHLK